MIPLIKLRTDWRIQLMGHTVRLSSTRSARKALRWISDGGKRPQR